MKKRILCFGDSLTWGADPADGGRLPEDCRWPTVLQARLGGDCAIIEEGQGGRTIASDDPTEGEKSGIRYILPCLESHSPFDLLIIMLGTNDCKRKFAYPIQDIGWEMERFLEKVMTHRHFACQDRYKVLLVSPPLISEAVCKSWLGDLFAYEEGIRKSRSLSSCFRQLAERYDCLFLNAADYAAVSDLDGIHLDGENQRKLGIAIADFIKQKALVP